MDVKEIKPTIIPGVGIQRVAAYARVSSEKDMALHSLSAQISYYNEKISKHPGWELAEIYADEGISGTLDKRPEFQRMLKDCREGKIDLILTKSVSRFARNTVTLLETMRELRALNIDIYFENERLHSISEGGDFMIKLLALMAEEYSRSASENMHWRIQKKFESGLCTGCARMIGYKIVKNEYIIIPEEAKIVQQIYADYLSGMKAEDIARKLNSQGIKTIAGNEWGGGSVRDILHNEKYMGDMLLQKTFTENYRTKRQCANKGQRKQYYVENSHTPIISKEDFRAVQEEFAKRRTQKAPYKRPIKTPFSGMIKCANCGKNFHRCTENGGKYYAKYAWLCSTKRKKGKDACNMKILPEPQLIVLTREALGVETLDGIDIKEYIAEIICDREHLTFRLKDGKDVIIQRRRMSYSDPKDSPFTHKKAGRKKKGEKNNEQ